MKKTIVITSIFEPTEAVKKFSQLKGFDLIVIGDKKSPKDFFCPGATYLSVKDQNGLDFKLIKSLPYNHYSRKMIGYLLAIQQNSDYIIDTDDDNIPKLNWKFPDFEGSYDCITDTNGFINIYQLFTDQKIWPRGLPLSLINTKFNFDLLISLTNCNVGVWQGLADEDPDVDAVYRLTIDEPCYFKARKPVVLSDGTICPFNTQNTIIIKQLFPLLYLPTYVTFRFTDILRGLVAQPIMWLYGYQLGFTDATVVQKRNPHNYMDDFISEIPMYQNCDKIVDIVNSVISRNKSITDNLYSAYDALFKESVVIDKELHTLEAWLLDLNKFSNI